MIKKDVQDSLIRGAVAEVFTKASAPQLKKLVKELSGDYSEGPRFYHTFEHIAEMLSLMKNFALPLENKQAFKAAVLYHDCIYDPARYRPKYESISNESQSAIICFNALENFGVKKDTARRARDLILMTEDHVAPEGDHEAALFLDLDMAILGMPRSRYEFYARGTAREFLSVLTPDEYLQGRQAFLKGVLKRDAIFKTQEFTRMEIAARENIAWELENLDAIVKRIVTARELKPEPAA